MNPSQRRPHHSMMLQCLELESRLNPSSLSVRFDTSFDTSGYFSDPVKMAALREVAASLTAQIGDNLTPIVASGSNTWSANFINPFTRSIVSVPNMVVNQNEIVIFVGAGQLQGNALGLAGGGAYSASGSQAWLDQIRTRGQTGVDNRTDYSTWGGMIGFSTNADWYFGNGTPPPTKYDFKSVAIHEMMHIFGFGLGNQSFLRHTTTGYFTGPNTTAVAGAVRMDGHDGHGDGHDHDHFAPTGTPGGVFSVMNPAILQGQSKGMTALEFAVLRDIGWAQVASPQVAPSVSSPAVPTTTAATTSSSIRPASSSAQSNTLAVGSGAGTGASLQVFGTGNQQIFNGAVINPAFTGGIRTATGDVTGDGITDYVVATGPGGAPLVEVIDGRSGATVRSFFAYDPSFRGGVYVAVGDVTGDGRMDIVTGAGAGGGPHVKVFDGVTGAEIIGFFGINDPNFTGGVRVAVGDFNKDGYADLIAAAGEGGGPRIAIWSGLTIAQFRIPTTLIPDFFAYEANLTNGAYIAVGNLNGDGDLKLITGAGEGGGPRISVFSARDLMAGRFIRVVDMFVGSPFSTTGVRVAAADLNNDGIDDLIAGPGPGSDGIVRVYAGSLGGVRTNNPLYTLSSTTWAQNGAFVSG